MAMLISFYKYPQLNIQRYFNLTFMHPATLANITMSLKNTYKEVI